MLSQVMEVLQAMGVLPAIQFIAITTGAIFIYKYFTRNA
jgi:hypothetical protein